MEGGDERCADAFHVFDCVLFSGDRASVSRVERDRACDRMHRDGVSEGPEVGLYGTEGEVKGRRVAIHVNLSVILYIERPVLELSGPPRGASRQAETEQEASAEARYKFLERTIEVHGTWLPIVGYHNATRKLGRGAHLIDTNDPALRLAMADFRLELDAPNNIVLVMVTEDDGSEHDYQFDFDQTTGRWEFAERDLLERDFGDDWVEEFEVAVDKMIKGAVEG